MAWPLRVITPIFVSRQAICMILPLWRQGKNTNEIVRILSIPEFEIANRLMHLRRPACQN